MIFIDNESKIRELSKELNKLSARFDHDFIELVDEGISYDLVADTMEDELIYEIEHLVVRFELRNPDIFILGLQRGKDDDGLPEVTLDWVDMTEEE